MAGKPRVVAINGSPQKGMGNTALLIEMLRPNLSREGFELEIINLSDHEIRYCTGCAFCMDKENVGSMTITAGLRTSSWTRTAWSWPPRFIFSM